MSSHPLPVDEFGRNNRDDHDNESRAGGFAGAESSFSQKAQEYLGGRRVQDFTDAAADQVSEAADYLRNTGAQRMKLDVEKLVKDNPGPAMLVAATVGFLIGRILSRR